ncbi:DUF3800 domain-containing protein [uncultured Pelagimonas sp.]|uniref:DUF3800 domain-containing protein n=1 Tax=uncultured Pelagimonas sp. TaxID=1618102 RepID=UPI00262CE052|nr:DUF3800 domain-containing protein [uncultured Pelagimonas sp.]
MSDYSPKKYVLLIDESGDQGLERVMTDGNPYGASSYLTMGATLVPTDFLDSFRETLSAISDTIGAKELHCVDLNHSQISYLAKEIAKLRMLCFGVVSKKLTLGSYKDELSETAQAQDYYNKCSQYLFELVCGFMALNDIKSSDISIVFEEKRGHDYQRQARYLNAVANKPIDKRAAKLNHLSPFIIDAKPKDAEPLLAIADCVAYGLHKAICSENNRLQLTEQRYLRELKGKFYKCPETGKIANHGIKFIKGPYQMALKGSHLEFVLKFYRENKPTN